MPSWVFTRSDDLTELQKAAMEVHAIEGRFGGRPEIILSWIAIALRDEPGLDVRQWLQDEADVSPSRIAELARMVQKEAAEAEDRAYADTVLAALMDAEPKLPEHGGDRKKETGEPGQQVDNINLQGGTGASYTLRRLKRDRPDLAQKVIDGELSANAAAIQAGFRRKKATFDTDDAGAAIDALLRHFTREQLAAAIASRDTP